MLGIRLSKHLLEASDITVAITVLLFSWASILNFSVPFRSTLSMFLFSSLNPVVKCQVESSPKTNMQDRSNPRTIDVQAQITPLGMWQEKDHTLRAVNRALSSSRLDVGLQSRMASCVAINLFPSLEVRR